MNRDKNSTESKYLRAYKRVKKIKSFYNHVMLYIIFNIVILIVKIRVFDFVGRNTADVDQGFLDWMDINLWATPVLWGIGLIIHGLYVYRHKFTFVRDWENRKIKKFIDEDKEGLTKTHHWE